MNHMTVAEAREALINQVQEDDSNTCCPLCKHRVRNDVKGLNRWMAAALKAIYYHSLSYPNEAIHVGDLVKGTDGSRGHDAALLRHWGLIISVERPESASPKLKGSRGLSGFYRITKLGVDFVEGREKVQKNIVKMFGLDEVLADGPFITFTDATRSAMETSADGIVSSGETVA